MKVQLSAIFEQFEFITPGAKFDELWDQINNHLAVSELNDVYIEITVNILTIASFQTIINLIFGLRQIYSQRRPRVFFELSNLSPEFLNAQLLPASSYDIVEHAWAFMMKKSTSDSIFTSDELDQVQTLLDWLNQGCNKSKEYAKLQYVEFYHHIMKLQNSSDKKFEDVFPELQNFYKTAEHQYLQTLE